MEERNKRIGEEIQPADIEDELLGVIMKNADYRVLYGYTYDTRNKTLVKAEDDCHCVAHAGNAFFNGISRDKTPFALTDEEQEEQDEILKDIQALLNRMQAEREATKEKLCEIDADTTWRLISVEDHEGNSKVDTRAFYKERLNCIAKNIRYGEGNAFGHCRIHMDFIQNPDGQWINRHLHTSQVLEAKQNGNKLTIYTRNSVYILQKEEIEEPEYQDVAELIELYFDDSYEHFCRGTYYDGEKRPHDLVGHTHSGMFTDTYLVGLKDEYGFGSYACRYYLGSNQIEFYDTLYNQQDYATRMLIHNTGNEPLKIKFEGYHATWTIAPGESKYIIPFRADGADKE